MESVFVYGTLKRGQPNVYVLESDNGHGASVFRGLAITEHQYPLVVAGRYNTPYLLDAKGQGKHIKGEIHEVDSKIVEKLDEFEGHPHYYQRDKISVQMLPSLEIRECWCYFLRNYKPEMNDLEAMEDFNSSLLNYIPPWERPKGLGNEHWSDVLLTKPQSSSNSSTMECVFVYGTLKSGQPNDYLLQNDKGRGTSVVKGEAVTEHLYPLVVGGRYNTPYILDAKGQGKHIKGEIYEVDSKMMETLDEVEYHPQYYQRDRISAQMMPSLEIRECWCYFLRNYKPEMNDLEAMEEFNSSSVNYTPPWERPKGLGNAHWSDVLLGTS